MGSRRSPPLMAWRAAAAIAGATTWRKARERPGRRGDADTDGKDAGDRAYCESDAGAVSYTHLTLPTIYSV